MSATSDKIVIILAVVFMIIVVVLAMNIISNLVTEQNYIDNASCESLKIYIDAGREGKTYFAYWTLESQETVNFTITSKNVDEAQLKYEWECRK